MQYSYIIVSCYIENPQGNILMINLKKIGKWGFPGGKVEIGETPRNALKREIKEEFGVEVDVDKLIGFREYFWESDNAYWTDLIYKAKIVRGNPTIMEPEKILEIDWKDKTFVPPDTKFVSKLSE